MFDMHGLRGRTYMDIVRNVNTDKRLNTVKKEDVIVNDVKLVEMEIEVGEGRGFIYEKTNR